MDAIEKMIARMNEQAENERLLYKQKRLSEIEDKFNREQAFINQENEQQLKKQIQIVEKKYKQQRDRQQVVFRQEALHHKQEVLTRYFEEAIEKMNAWSQDDTQTFSEQLLQTIPLTTPMTIQVGELSRAYLNQDWVLRMNQQYNRQMRLLEEVIPKQAGFILNDHGVQYNFIFENLVKELQPTMGVELAKRLFD
ncbi:ATPase V [Vagococcus zengguangii]|uniref:ATPase V n=1 Tax=Vagococcus zengguangii TaxID=2571750 RepID=A0A4D7CSP4_9ENTE|nr:ATPase V [Vagococcus zengguangii]QCI85954.1 ATPase V [Vagococcus zengguangii]TLG80301.1 ATPase V [Vagococcus zengguangii]